MIFLKYRSVHYNTKTEKYLYFNKNFALYFKIYFVMSKGKLFSFIKSFPLQNHINMTESNIKQGGLL